jgi:hypothetical protein
MAVALRLYVPCMAARTAHPCAGPDADQHVNAADAADQEVWGIVPGLPGLADPLHPRLVPDVPQVQKNHHQPGQFLPARALIAWLSGN